MRNTVRCPTCRRQVAWQGNSYRPFCSERCQMVDLGAWAAERYRIAGEPAAESLSPEDSDGEDPPARPTARR